MLLRKNFTRKELMCDCCGDCNMDNDLLDFLQEIRNEYGRLIISSGFRCKKRNGGVGGIKGSLHTQGLAVDIFTKKESSTALFNLINIIIELSRSKFKDTGKHVGLGIYSNHVHVDLNNRPTPILWVGR